MSDQFQRGFTFGDKINSTQELYDLIEKAIAKPGLISEQGQANPASSDFLFALVSGLLAKVSIQSIIEAALPAGIEVPYGGTSAPSGWILAYGQPISRTTYARLFAVYGTIYGSGDGSTTFNVPDYRGRTPFGKDDMGGVAAGILTNITGGIVGATLGATGGEQSHTLILGEIPAHGHGYSTPSGLSGPNDGRSDGGSFRATGLSAGSATTNNAGGGGAHNNIPPGIVRNWIIKV